MDDIRRGFLFAVGALLATLLVSFLVVGIVAFTLEGMS